jgi:hypothetical protein
MAKEVVVEGAFLPDCSLLSPRGRGALRALEAAARSRIRAPLCLDCGKNRADPPSRLCPGCQAYREHQQ